MNIMRLTSLMLTASLAMLTACDQLPELKKLGDISDMHLFTPTQEVSSTSSVSPRIEKVETSGMKAWLIQDKTQPLFSVQLVFEGAGSSSDPAARRGRAMFASALLDEGAGDMNALAFQKALDDKAIQLDFQTTEDALVVNLRSLSANKEEAFRLLGLALTKPRFDKDAVARKRNQAFSALLQAEKNPSYILSKNFKELAYPGHVYSQPDMGTKNSLTSMSAADCKQYASNWLTKGNVYISLAGDVDAASLAILLNENLDGLADHVSEPQDVQKISMHHLGTLKVVKQPIPQSIVLFGTPAIDRKDPRFIAGYVLNQIIGGDTLTSKLGMAIREQRGLAYSVNTSLNPMTYSSTFGGMFATRNDQAESAYQALLDTASDIKTQGVSEEDLKRAKEYLTGAFSRSLDTNSELVNYLNIMQRYDLGMDYLMERNAKINAVTLDEVNALARDWMDAGKWLVVVVGSPEKLKSGSSLLNSEKPLEAPVISPAPEPMAKDTTDQPTEKAASAVQDEKDDFFSVFIPKPSPPPTPKPAATNNLNSNTVE